MMAMTTFVQRSSIALAAGLLLAATACSIQVDPSKDGKDKSVKIQTPLGGIHVNTNEMVAADIGLPAYPGATVTGRKEKNDRGKHDGNADVDIHFGDWQLRVKVLKFHSEDSQDKVVAFYRKALSRYGDVIECKDEQAVGTPIVTRQGLGCKDDSSRPHGGANINLESSSTLKAGSKRHQHIVGIENTSGDGTDFSLIALDLPAEDAMHSKDEPKETN
jgi:hypothetical protein